jgi:UDP-N-acetyl-D-glucosamine dehydrogenase
MKIAVIGLGKIGLPLAVQYAQMGHQVMGVDINQNVVRMVNQGTEPFPEEKDLQKFLSVVVKSNRLRATSSYEDAVGNSEVIVVAVPVVVDQNAIPDFSTIDNASRLIGRNLARGALVCFETTLPIGTTRNRLTPQLEEESSLKAEEDFHVVFSPERVFTGRIFEDLRKYPKIVGGLSDKCSLRGKEFYEAVLRFDQRSDLSRPNGVWVVRNAETAEFIKLAETTYRDVNIGLANQFSRFADQIGINIFEVIQATNSQPFSHIHMPGIAVGGHCIPVYPHFYLQSDPSADIVKAARNANASAPKHAIKILKSKIGSLNGKNVLVLGVSYRSNVKESAFSGAFALRDDLLEEGATVKFTDPYFTTEELTNLGLEPLVSEKSEIHAVILHTAHVSFKNFIDHEFVQCLAVIDGRNFLTQGDVIPPLYTLGNL